ncbi:histidine phosphatase family protein [Priestia megaterium]
MLYLIRHGQTDWNKNKLIQGHADIPLNEAGKQQAKRVAERFRDIHIDVIYTSDLLRAQETAREIAAAAKVEKLKFVSSCVSALWRTRIKERRSFA